LACANATSCEMPKEQEFAGCGTVAFEIPTNATVPLSPV
jgi:hypothetical protein